MSAPFPADPFRGEPPAIEPNYGAMPTIFQLGLLMADARASLRQIDDATEKRPTSVHEDTIYDLLMDQTEVLDRLISTLPAVTLADAAVQVEVASTIASDLVGLDWTMPGTHPRLNRLHTNIFRLMLSALLPVIAEAAKLDANLMRWDDTVDLKKAHFQLEECDA